MTSKFSYLVLFQPEPFKGKRKKNKTKQKRSNLKKIIQDIFLARFYTRSSTEYVIRIKSSILPCLSRNYP